MNLLNLAARCYQFNIDARDDLETLDLLQINTSYLDVISANGELSSLVGGMEDELVATA